VKVFRNLFAALFLLPSLAVGSLAQSFSAQDVMSVCVTTPQDLSQIDSILLARGWKIVTDAPSEKMLQDLRMAFVAAQYTKAQPIQGTRLNGDRWKNDWLRIQTFLAEGLRPNLNKLFYHGQSGAVLLFSDYSTKLGLAFSCLLAVPQVATTASSYFPKLIAPTAPVLSLTIGDYLALGEIIRSQYEVQAASLDPSALSKALDIDTDVGAAFFSRVAYPKLAVLP
jgi:hypothetical protein